MNTPQDPDAGTQLPGRTPRPRPTPLYLAIVVLGVEGLLAVGVLLWYIASFMTGEYTDLESTLVQILLIAIAAAWIIGTAIGMFLGKNLAKASGVVVQILFVALGVTFIQSGASGWLLYGSIGALVLAGLALLLIFNSKVTEFFVDDEPGAGFRG